MSSAAIDPALSAFRRLLVDAAAGGQQKVDAIVALAQRTVWVATWTSLGDDYRTLVNSNNLSALPVFTAYDTLDEAANRFGWKGPDGSIPSREVGARDVLRHAIAHNLEYVVIDISTEHALEIEKSEIAPLVASQKRDSQGPYAAVGRISSNMMKAVKPASSRPPAGDVTRTPSPVPPAPPVPTAMPSIKPANFSPGNSRSSVPPTAPMSDKTAAGTQVHVSPLLSEPAAAMVTSLAEALRGYPEVEWAALCLVSHGPAGPVASVGVRVDGAFRQRVNEIAAKLRQIGESHGAPLGTLMLDDAAVMRTIRSDGYLFYPWKKR